MDVLSKPPWMGSRRVLKEDTTPAMRPDPKKHPLSTKIYCHAFQMRAEM
jgi:hypothetical protein